MMEADNNPDSIYAETLRLLVAALYQERTFDRCIFYCEKWREYLEFGGIKAGQGLVIVNLWEGLAYLQNGNYVRAEERLIPS